jgi:hypothetical protein
MTLAARMSPPGRSAAEVQSWPRRPAAAGPRSWRGRAILRAAVSAALIAVAFGQPSRVSHPTAPCTRALGHREIRSDQRSLAVG